MNNISIPKNMEVSVDIFEKYEKIVVGRGKWKKVYIVGKNPKNNSSFEYKIFSDNRILRELLALYQSIRDNADYDIKTIRKVLKWCEKYGLPIIDEDLPDNLIGFSLKSFVNNLKRLYRGFELANELTRNDKGADADLLYMFNVNCGLKANMFLEKKDIAFNDRKSQFYVVSHILNHIDLARYQLMLFVMFPNQGNIKDCSKCNNWFIASRSNQKYCPNCNSKSAWREKNKKQLKEGEK